MIQYQRVLSQDLAKSYNRTDVTARTADITIHTIHHDRYNQNIISIIRLRLHAISKVKTTRQIPHSHRMISTRFPCNQLT